MDLKGIILSEISQTEKEKYSLLSSLYVKAYMLNLKKENKLVKHNKKTSRLRDVE